jgi:signal transduction histidine kinase
MLRWRVFAGFVALLLLILFSNGYAIYLFLQTGKSIEGILKHNYQSIQAVQSLENSLMNISMTYLSQDKEVLNQWDVYTENKKNIEEKLQFLEKAASSTEETIATAEVKKLTTSFFAFYQKVISGRVGGFLGRKEMVVTASALNLDIKKIVNKLLALNEKEIADADLKARSLSKRSVELVIVLLLLFIILALYIYQRFYRNIVIPIDYITRSILDLEKGVYGKTIEIETTAELSHLTQAFNKASQKLKLYSEQLSERLIRLNNTIRTVLESFPDPIILLDQNHRVQFKNKSAIHFISEVSTSDHLPQSVIDLIDSCIQSKRELISDDFAKTLAFKFKDQERFYSPYVLFLHDEDDKMFGMAIILNDVTKLRLSNELKSNIISTVSHEVRTPLTGVRMTIHLLLEERLGKLTDDQKELLENSRNDCERLLKLLNDLLDLAKLERGSIGLSLKKMEPKVIVEDARKNVASLLQTKHLHLTSEVEKDLPFIMADRDKLGIAIYNYLSNAAKYSPDEAEIKIEIKTVGEKIRFAVIDHGDGISQDKLERLFEKFYRVEGQKEKGAGLGLSIAKEIIMAHQGEVGVESTLGKGTTFYFDLPFGL